MVASHTTGPWIDPWRKQSEHFLFLCSGGAFESVWAPPLIAQIAKWYQNRPSGLQSSGIEGEYCNMWILRGELQSLIPDCRVEGYLRVSDCGL